jgi:hypothetical protein
MIQFALFAPIVGLAYFLIIRLLRPLQKRSVERLDSTPERSTDLGSLMSAVQDQAVELRGKQGTPEVDGIRISRIERRYERALAAFKAIERG